MASATAIMPSSISSGSTEHRRSGSEAGPRGFTAVNIPSPPRSRGTHEQRMAMDKTNGGPESSATSPDVSPRQDTAGAGRYGTSSDYYINSHDAAQRKRQRSLSPDRGPPSPRRYNYHPPKKVDTQQQQQMADKALQALDTTNHQPPHSYYSTTPHAQERTGYAYDRPMYHTPNGAHSMSPEARMTDGYSREPSEHQYASSANGGDQEKQEDGMDKSNGMHSGQKRKRNFSNRTKTGCITCRTRKKKCDEGRPFCNNCIRGGFTCHGYNPNHSRPQTWTKPTPQKQPIPLQSKENDEPASYNENMTPISAHPSSAETSQSRPPAAGDGHDQSRPQYAPTPATPAESRPAYSGQQQHQPQWAQRHQQQPQGHSPQSAYPSEHLPPLAEVARPEPRQAHHRQAFSGTPSHEMSRPPTQPQPVETPSSANMAPAENVPTWQQVPQTRQPQQQTHSQPQAQYQASAPQQQEHPPRSAPYPPRINTAQPQFDSSRLHTASTANTANTAYSSYEQKPGSKNFSIQDVERSRMQRGAPYNYFDGTLKDERTRCANALLRYNNACQLTSGVSEEEAQKMLIKVFDPKQDSARPDAKGFPMEGHLGPGVKIEPGFRCTYGYNIRIFDNVFIGENTRLDDSAKIDIGARTWISANVTILTNDVAKDAVQRKGTDGQQCSAQPVSIGPEVVIGTGAVIFPGVKIGRGSTIEPFAVVKESLADFSMQRVYQGQPLAPLGSANY